MLFCNDLVCYQKGANRVKAGVIKPVDSGIEEIILYEVWDFIVGVVGPFHFVGDKFAFLFGRHSTIPPLFTFS